MAKYIIDESTMTALANATRSKASLTDPLTPGEINNTINSLVVYDIELDYEPSPAFWSVINITDSDGQLICLPVLEDRILIYTSTGDDFKSTNEDDVLLTRINDNEFTTHLTYEVGGHEGTKVYPGMIVFHIPATLLKDYIIKGEYTDLYNRLTIYRNGSIGESAETHFRESESYDEFMERMHRVSPDAVFLETLEDINEYDWKSQSAKDWALWYFDFN